MTLLNGHQPHTTTSAVAPAEPAVPTSEPGQERPYWQTQPCPAWCAYGPHTDRDDPIHMNGVVEVIALSTAPSRLLPAPYSAEIPPYLDLYLSQHELHRDPQVRMFVDTRDVFGEFSLSLSEAQALAQALSTLIATAMADAR